MIADVDGGVFDVEIGLRFAGRGDVCNGDCQGLASSTDRKRYRLTMSAALERASKGRGGSCCENNVAREEPGDGSGGQRTDLSNA